MELGLYGHTIMPIKGINLKIRESIGIVPFQNVKGIRTKKVYIEFDKDDISNITQSCEKEDLFLDWLVGEVSYCLVNNFDINQMEK